MTEDVNATQTYVRKFAPRKHSKIQGLRPISELGAREG